ncbi:hypothetical protein GGR52DRAFT_517488 [Hypoxylon sp. FL1284]|nr:hypothetical protein GGR52DRAFT_517488 [Hypoxylon sp. FL1284]
MAFTGPYGDDDDPRVLGYDFITEVSPGVWKVCDKENRAEWLAHDMTSSLTGDPLDPTKDNEEALQTLMKSTLRVRGPVFTLLSHDNLVRLGDWITVKKPRGGKNVEYRTYAVWDYCEAGVLGNLIVPPPIHNKTREMYPEDENHNFGFADDYALHLPQPEAFLPESLCWHVLLSIMKALAWLHDGSWEVIPDRKTGKMSMKPEPNWQPIMHRNITPNNIFFQHPQATEWYGPCKLGNYANMFISGHHNGPSKTRDYSKPLAPHPLTEFQGLEELIEEDAARGYSYPHKPDQPYTLISELRALGEVIQQMMIKPGYLGDLETIRRHSVVKNLLNLPYSNLLKNAVTMLMTYNPDEKKLDGSGYMPYVRECFTSTICTQAYERFLEWQRSGDPEAAKATLREHAIARQQKNEYTLRIVEQLRQDAVRKAMQTDDKIDPAAYATSARPRPSIDHLPITSATPATPYMPADIVPIANENMEEKLKDLDLLLGEVDV